MQGPPSLTVFPVVAGPVTSLLQWAQEELLISQSAQLGTCGQDGLATSKLLPCWAGSQNLWL